MPSRPGLARLSAQIAELGGDQYIFDKVVEGVTVRDLMAEFGFTHGMLYHWLRAGGEERKKGYELAKKASAEAHAEDAGTVLKDMVDRGAGVSPAQVSAASNYSKYKQWLAAKRDREQFGDAADAQVNINLNLGDAHLQALRELGRMDNEPIENADYELLEESTDESD